MFVMTGKNSALANQVIEFMANIYPNLTEVDIEVIPTDLTEDNVFGWSLENNNQFEIEIHDKLGYFDFVTTLIHELVHVDQKVIDSVYETLEGSVDKYYDKIEKAKKKQPDMEW